MPAIQAAVVKAGLVALAFLAVSAAGPGCGPAPERSTSASQPAPTTGGNVQRPPIAQVLERHTDEILALPSVVGIGEGAEGNDAVIVVFVTRLTPEVAARLPREIEGYRVVPRESGEVRAQPR